MSSTATTTTSATSNLRSLGWCLLCLVVILGVLFSRSFHPSAILFANDAPLGALKSQDENALSNFFGAWQPLNWLGIQQPSSLPDVTYLFFWLVGAVGYAKFYVPVALLLLGLSAWFFLRRLGLSQAASVLGGVAASLNTDPFSYACWGLAPISVCMAAIFTALGCLAPRLGDKWWAQLALAGLCVGFSIMEGYDTGAILSLYVAAFVLFQALVEPRAAGIRVVKGLGRVGLVAMLAAFMAAQALSTLIGTQVKGIVGTEQDSQTKEQRWTEATMWSLPKIETLRVIIPGLFGYRMDSPGGGNYWGSVGQVPGVPQSRHSGSGVYAGLLVVLVAIWGVARAAHSSDSPYTAEERRWIWFWAGAAVVSLLLAYGRHAPFYQFFYKLPYFSTIRNPVKFMHPFTISIVVLFGYGLEGLWRSYVQRNRVKSGSLGAQLRAWWQTVPRFDRRWTVASLTLLGAALLGYLLYLSSQRELERYLLAISAEGTELPPSVVPQVIRFSMAEVGWFVLFLALDVAALILVVSGAVSGRRARWAPVLLGALLIGDLARASTPWILYENYQERYADNPVFSRLRQAPYDHRVAARMNPMAGGYLAVKEAQSLMAGVVDQEWLQHQFQFYRIQSLDIVQMPRMPALDAAYMAALTSRDPTRLPTVGRLWQLTNTRFIIGMAGFLDAINQQIDPTNRSFRVDTTFEFAPRNPASPNAGSRPQEITAVLRPDGQFAIFEFGAALPRTQLYSTWQVVTNDSTTLERLTDPAFDPRSAVLVDRPLAAPPPAASQNPGTARIARYAPKHITIEANPTVPAVLLLNDRFNPNWRVRVDGQPAPLLRCNYIMRGVYLQPGHHQVQFDFEPPHAMLYVSLAALALGIALCGYLAVGARAGQAAPSSPAPLPASTPSKSKA